MRVWVIIAGAIFIVVQLWWVVTHVLIFKEYIQHAFIFIQSVVIVLCVFNNVDGVCSLKNFLFLLSFPIPLLCSVHSEWTSVATGFVSTIVVGTLVHVFGEVTVTHQQCDANLFGNTSLWVFSVCVSLYATGRLFYKERPLAPAMVKHFEWNMKIGAIVALVVCSLSFPANVVTETNLMWVVFGMWAPRVMHAREMQKHRELVARRKVGDGKITRTLHRRKKSRTFDFPNPVADDLMSAEPTGSASVDDVEMSSPRKGLRPSLSLSRLKEPEIADTFVDDFIAVVNLRIIFRSLCCVEILDLYDAVMEYIHHGDTFELEERKKFVDYVWNTFIRQGSDLEVNFSGERRAQIEEMLAAPPLTIFDKLKDDLDTLIDHTTVTHRVCM
jgi:hypothetical protein